ncbi:MAG: Bax inhibitor-1/YccA family protein [Lawsonibacter sp.]|nr:Bax inhibitor-1/YccA family protein [Lawsonibacter sp.]
MSFNPYEFDNSMQRQVDSIGQYTAKTFLWMVLGLMITFTVAVGSWFTGAVYLAAQLHWVILIATLVMSFTMARRIEKMRVGSAVALFVGFSFLFGLTCSVYLAVYGLGLAVFCFLATAVYFAALAAYGYLTHRDLSSLRTILFSGLIFLIVFGLLTWIIPWFQVFDQIVCLVGIAIFLAYTAYDTQKIKAYYSYYAGYPDMLAKASIFSALQLYLDFLNMFLYLLRFLGNRRN